MNNTLHIKQATRLNYGMIKMPFTLAKPLALSTLQKKLAAAAKKQGNCAIAKIKLCTPTYGYVTFAPQAKAA